MTEAKLNQSQLARRIGINQAAVSRLLSGVNSPSGDTCNAIADGLDIPIEEVLRAAGILPPATEEEIQTEKILFLYQKSTPEERQRGIEFFRFMLNQRDKAEGKDAPRHNVPPLPETIDEDST